jgi:ribA/ribD-fused uncharacterized protein
VNLVAPNQLGTLLEGHTVVTGTGHRPQDIAAYATQGFTALVNVATKMIVASKATLVIAGGAIGWDTALAAAALQLELPLVLALPFPGHEKRWRAPDQALYQEHAEQANAVVFISEETPGDDMDLLVSYMEARNAFMVDHAQLLLAFWSGKQRGGTANCVRYAKRVGIKIVNGWTPTWGIAPLAPLKTVVSLSVKVLHEGYEVTLKQDRSDRVKVIRQTRLRHAIPVKGKGVLRAWQPKAGRAYGPSNPARQFLMGMIIGARAVKKADEVRFDLTPSQWERIKAMQVDASRDFYDRQNTGGFVTRALHARLKEQLVDAVSRFPHNLGRLSPKGDIAGFRADYSFLSNFYPCKVTLDGEEYRSVEAAFQASKTLDPVLRTPFTTSTPAEAKAKGKTLKLRPDWETVKLDIMADLLAQKFAPRTKLARLLADTGTRQLIEENTWYDTYWGVCNGKGQNHLGKLLMELRHS